MNKLTQFNEGLKTIAVLAFVCVCGFLCSTLIHVNKTLNSADTALGTLNQEVKSFDGTRQHVDALLGSATLVLNDADTATKKETSVLDAFNTQVNGTLSNLNTAITAVTASQADISSHTVQTLDAVKFTVNGLNPVLGTVQATVADIDTQVKNPAISTTLTQVQITATQSAGVATNLNKTTADVQEAVHSYLHPTWETKLKNALVNGGETAIKYFF